MKVWTIYVFMFLFLNAEYKPSSHYKTLPAAEWWWQILILGLYLLLVPAVQGTHISHIQRRWNSNFTSLILRLSRPFFFFFDQEYAFSNKTYSNLSIWQHIDHHSSSWKPWFLAAGSAYSSTPAQVHKSLQDRMIYGTAHRCEERRILTHASMCNNVLQSPTVLSV